MPTCGIDLADKLEYALNVINSPLWSNRDFLKLWLGQSISQFGAQITLLALPLAAAQMLQATSFQMGILRAAEYVPFILFGMFAGVLADRMDRKKILIIGDLARTLFLAGIPIAAFYDKLAIEILYVSAFLVGSVGVFFDIAYWSYLPSLVSRNELVEGNSKLTLSQSAAESLGPGAAGILIQTLTAPFAIMVNAASFLISALSLMAIKTKEHPTKVAAVRHGIWRELTLGLVFVFREPTLQSLMVRATVWNFIYNFGMPVFLLYCTNTLGLGSAFIGFMFACMGAGFIVGVTLMETRLAAIGIGKLICISMLCAALAACGIAIRSENMLIQNALLVVCLFVIGVANSIYNINNVSLRQALTPPELLGRMTAAMRFVSWGIMPFGAFLGGAAGERIGLHATLMMMGAGGLLAGTIGMIAGPVKRITSLPAA